MRERESVMNFGKEIIIKDDVKYIGPGEDPNNNLGFKAWKKAYKDVYGRCGHCGFPKTTRYSMMVTCTCLR
jgi:hypothetical protein